RERRMRVICGIEVESKLGERRHLDMAVAIAVIEEGDAACFTVALLHGYALDLGPQRANGLLEHRLVVMECGVADLSGRSFRRSSRRPPLTSLRVRYEQEGARLLFKGIAIPACNG